MRKDNNDDHCNWFCIHIYTDTDTDTLHTYVYATMKQYKSASRSGLVNYECGTRVITRQRRLRSVYSFLSLSYYTYALISIGECIKLGYGVMYEDSFAVFIYHLFFFFFFSSLHRIRWYSAYKLFPCAKKQL